MNSTDTEEKLGISSYGQGEIKITGVRSDEMEKIEASIRGGHHWIRRGKNGHLEFVPSYEELPKPTEDREMLPFWRRKKMIGHHVQFKLFDHTQRPDEYSRYSHPSIIIQHLCGYSYSEENYKRNAERLESFGFICFRSRRDDGGKFWEMWCLLSTCFAKGDLKEEINKSKYKNEKLKIKVAVSFLARAVSFGTLDVSVQRLAACVE